MEDVMVIGRIRELVNSRYADALVDDGAVALTPCGSGGWNIRDRRIESKEMMLLFQG
jgi:hypothetical protein